MDPIYGYGALLDNSGASAPKAVVLNGTNRFYTNSIGGLYINSVGAITLNKITASYNGQNPGGGDGAHLDNSGSITPQAVTLKGNNSFYGNWNNGLQVVSQGAITVNNLTSNSNGDGAELYNTSNGPSSPQNVTLNGFGEFNDNYNNGLEILSYGAITLNNVDAGQNGHGSGTNGFGVYLDNYQGDAVTAKAVSLKGYNTFNNNLDGGLEIHSLGAIDVSNLNAQYNDGFGAFLDNNNGSALGGVTITKDVSIIRNGDYGMQVTSRGAITINVVDAWIADNGSYGWHLDNTSSTTSAGITLGTTGAGENIDFSRNGDYGLWVQSKGVITIKELDAWGNTSYGVTLDNSTASPPKAVTISGTSDSGNSFGDNGTDGLVILSKGAVTLANLDVYRNGASGVMVDNQTYGSPTAPQAVTLSGNNNFDHNFMNGLEIYSYGAVLLKNIDASNNGVDDWWTPAGPEFGWGVYINNVNPNALYVKPVTLTGVNTFTSNWNSGLEIWSSGLVSLSNVTAKWNGNYYEASPAYSFLGPDGTEVGCGNTINNGANDFYVGCGAYIDNSAAFTPLGVTITGTNLFDGNTLTGLTVISDGLISLSNVTANNNGWFADWSDVTPDTVFGFGADLISNFKGVTLTGTNTFNGNWEYGLHVDALETITINNLTANWNGDRGAFLQNQFDQKHANVTITGFATTDGNGGDGLSIFTNGSVSLINVNANQNAGDGAYIDAYDDLLSSQGGSAANVRILGANSFTGNAVTGLEVYSDGVITLNNITANRNGGTGALLDSNTLAHGSWLLPTATTINLTGVNTFNRNSNSGLEFNARGNVTMTKITADRNGGNGVLGAATGNITLTCGSMTGNTLKGYFLSAFRVTLTGVNTFGNGSPNSAVSTGPLPTLYNRVCPLP